MKLLRAHTAQTTLLIAVATFTGTARCEDALPGSMAALGDSITASAFAAFPRQESQKFTSQLGLIFGGLTALMTRAFNKNEWKGIEARELSWATGLDVDMRVISHARRLQYMNPKMKIFNGAISGGTSQTVDEKEIVNVREWSRKKLKKEYPDYVAILIGPNDICIKDGEQMTNESDFEARMERVVEDILAKNKDSKILISAIPNIVTLRDVAKDAPAFQYKGMETCQKVWERVPFCPNLQQKDNREEETKRLLAFNSIIRNLAFDKNQVHGGDRVRVAESIYRYDFTPNDLALDCFHPNHFAHSMLADMTFEETWWSKDWNVVRDNAMTKFTREKRADQERRRRAGQHHPNRP